MLSSLTNYNVVCFGEVLWDILPSKTLPGGAPMNVAYHLKKLGACPALITKVGIDDYGKKLVNLMSEEGLNTDYFQMDYNYPTGLVYAKTNDHHEVIYDIVYPSAWDYIQWQGEFQKLIEEAGYFVYGSLTSRSKETRDTLYQLLDTSTTKVLDINLRPPHFNRSGVEYLLKRANILKVNIAELELITGWFSQFERMEDRIKVLQEQFNIRTIIVTMGANGSIVNNEGSVYRHPGFEIQVADTIGSGDAYLSGFLWQQMNGAALAQSLVFASALGALVATYSGACPNYQLTEIHSLINNSRTKIQNS
ncbi:MAG TPA: carbohydrate kinase [Flavisolibacter sp.]|jgi:fructokinase|nr:carbohydrate kinase [Flavisolibacter sp.]